MQKKKKEWWPIKKLLTIIFVLFISISLFSCKTENKDKVSVITPGGIPLLSIAGLLDDDSLSIEAVNGAEHLQTALSSNSHDIVIAPLNLGAKLYAAAKSNYKIAAVVTLNNAYIVTREENPFETIDDLVGKEIYGFGKAGIPGSLLTKLYIDNEKLDISALENNWYESSSEVYGLFKGNTGPKYALMSEPEISKLVLNDKIAIKTHDICSLLNLDVVPQACVFVNPNSEREKVEKVLEQIKINVKNLNDNPIEYAEKIIPLHASFKTMGKDVIVRAIPLTNISYLEADEAKSEIVKTLLIVGVNKELGNEFYY